KKAVKKDGVNDGAANEYDLNDSFIDDEVEEEYEPTDEDSDWEPSSEEKDNKDVETLVQETLVCVSLHKWHGVFGKGTAQANTGRGRMQTLQALDKCLGNRAVKSLLESREPWESLDDAIPTAFDTRGKWRLDGAGPFFLVLFWPYPRRMHALPPSFEGQTSNRPGQPLDCDITTLPPRLSPSWVLAEVTSGRDAIFVVMPLGPPVLLTKAAVQLTA
ncbi:hypothetical protein HGM15179_015829, partial [Zosterops borbonicus]